MHTSATTNTPAPRKLHYTLSELAEFKALLQAKMRVAAEDLAATKESLARTSSNGTDDTYFGNRGLEDGSASLEREELMMISVRQEKFIEELRKALERINNGSYGICRATGQLIPKDRLRLVPHATLCIAAKQNMSAQRAA